MSHSFPAEIPDIAIDRAPAGVRRRARSRLLAAGLLAAGLLAPTGGGAQDGIVGYACRDTLSSARWSFAIDFDNELVRADVPVNWTWITAGEVIFAHATHSGGRQHLTQLYTLDRRSGVLESCDYSGLSEAAVPCSVQYVCRPNFLAFDNAL